ncbi:hypothetical protein ACH9EU_08455 [Kocuria sp. M1R5S2]|uniref:hypothetical protein n=1 Tax=Kocuria rhizosphaerae TaxID=3376285 RepID=UPI0037BA8A1D
MSRSSEPIGTPALLVLAAFLGVGVLSILSTGMFRLFEGLVFTGASWMALGALVAYGGVRFLREQWPR